MKQDTTTGNGSSTRQRTERKSDTAPTVARSKPSLLPSEQEATSISIAESLGSMQTLCSDLQTQGYLSRILVKDNVVIFAVKIPASIGKPTYQGGNVCLDGVPVREL